MSDTVAKRRPMIDLEQFERRLRQSNAASRTDDDPLAELARLPGGPDDPYKAMFEAPAARPAASAAEAQQRHEYDLDYDEGAAKEPEPHYFEPDHRLTGGSYAPVEVGLPPSIKPSHFHEDDVDLHPFAAADDQADHWRYEGEGAEPDGYEPERRSRRPLYIMAAIIVAGVAGIGASFALKGGSAPHDVAMIKAADGPAKIQPEGAEGGDAPNQNASILDRTPQSAPVAVADGAEQPVDLSRLPDHAPRVMAGGSGGAATVAVPRSPAQGAATIQSIPAPQTIAGLIEPKKVKTVSVRPDGTVLPSDAAPQTLAAAPSQAHTAPAPAPAAKAATPKSTARVATTPKPVQVADAQAGPAPAEAANPSSSGAFAVQLAAPTSEQEARDIQMRLIKKLGPAIPGFHPSIRKAVSGDKTVYRVRSVGLSKDEANALCQKVQSGGGACFVARN
jgi:cell division septation protein DedD